MYLLIELLGTKFLEPSMRKILLYLLASSQELLCIFSHSLHIILSLSLSLSLSHTHTHTDTHTPGASEQYYMHTYVNEIV